MTEVELARDIPDIDEIELIYSSHMTFEIENLSNENHALWISAESRDFGSRIAHYTWSWMMILS